MKRFYRFNQSWLRIPVDVQSWTWIPLDGQSLIRIPVDVQSYIHIPWMVKAESVSSSHCSSGVFIQVCGGSIENLNDREGQRAFIEVTF